MHSSRPRHFVVIGALLLAAYWYWHSSSGVFTATTSRLPVEAGFDWKALPLKHPQKVIVTLPTASPKQLPTVQYDFAAETAEDAETRKTRQKAVKDAFLRSWNSYKKYAWKADELQPISTQAKASYGGWAASLVDSLDTLWIMGLRDDFDEAVDAVMSIRFDTTPAEEINLFETTIRYLGGMLAAYDLSKDARLLEKARGLGDMLLVAFDTPNNLPLTRWRMRDARMRANQIAHGTVLIAEMGSLSMEFTRLSQLTGDDRYYSAIERITRLFAEQQDLTLLPGMWPIIMNAYRANMTSHDTFTLGGMADSAYEYIPKMHALLGGADPTYENMYKKFSATALSHNVVRARVPSDEDILTTVDVIVKDKHVFLNEKSQHLSCFTGGMFALAGRLLSLPEHVDVGKKLTDGCVWMYNAMPTGIMPELFQLMTCARTEPCPWDEDKWRNEIVRRSSGEGGTPEDADKFILAERLPKGLTAITDKRYMLRPEAIESVFILYRITGDKKYLGQAWTMFQNILELSWTKYANGMIFDVTVPRNMVRVGDVMESFWMAETLKYFYLIFSEPELISLDEWVFNTEAHPFRRPVGVVE